MIVVRLRVHCRPDKREELKSEFAESIRPSRAVDGVINFDIAQDLLDPNCFIATEIFDDEAAMNRQGSIPEVAKVMGILANALTAPTESTIYEVASAEKLSM